MTGISKLRKLLVRVESATAPDPRLDHAIKRMFPDGELGAPYYTDSIDAAVALCERVLQPQWIRTDIWRGQDASVGLLPNESPGDVTGARAPTLPLALCAAILRAKIAMLEKEAA
jgi:hypothetical protein